MWWWTKEESLAKTSPPSSPKLDRSRITKVIGAKAPWQQRRIECRGGLAKEIFCFLPMRPSGKNAFPRWSLPRTACSTEADSVQLNANLDTTFGCQPVWDQMIHTIPHWCYMLPAVKYNARSSCDIWPRTPS